MELKKQPQRMHHVTSHITNGLIPTASVFITLFLMTGNVRFEHAAMCCCAIGAIGTPLVYGTGFLDWRIRFKKRRGKVFKRKIIIGAVLVVLSLLMVAFRLNVGQEIATAGPMRFIFAGTVYILTGIVTYLGYLGGKFIV